MTSFHYEQVSLDAVMIDPRVQRSLDRARVLQMTKPFKSEGLGTPVLSRRADGLLIILDGGHRIAAARLAEYGEPIHAQVWEGLTLEQEAEMFLILNSSKTPSMINKFQVRVVASDDVAIKITQIVENNGWKIAQASSRGCINAVSALERIYLAAGGVDPHSGPYPELLDWTLATVTEAWGYEPIAAHSVLLTGVAMLAARFGDGVDSDKLVREMALVGPRELIARGRNAKASVGGTVPAGVARHLTLMHNRNRRTRFLPEWKWVR